MGLKTMGLSTILLVTAISGSALAKHQEGPFEKVWNSVKMREGLHGKKDFELKVTSEKKFLHWRNEVKIKVKGLDRHDGNRDDKHNQRDDRTCYKVEFSGHGNLFHELKDDLEDQFDNGNEMIEELHHLRVRRHSIEAVICDSADASDDSADFTNIDKVDSTENSNKADHKNDRDDD